MNDTFAFPDIKLNNPKAPKINVNINFTNLDQSQPGIQDPDIASTLLLICQEVCRDFLSHCEYYNLEYSTFTSIQNNPL